MAMRAARSNAADDEESTVSSGFYMMPPTVAGVLTYRIHALENVDNSQNVTRPSRGRRAILPVLLEGV